MAYWITHTVVADKICEKLPFLDKKGFVIGNIAPDCNIENQDFTAFEPPREVTHFMNGSHKSTTDYEKFYNLYIKGKEFASAEHYSFLLGYYSHLITDVKWVEYLHDEDRVKNCYERIAKFPELYEKIKDLPAEYYTLKNTFGKRCFLDDATDHEHCYIAENPENSYNRILRKTTAFPDYLDFLPKGAITRKIPVMTYEPPAEVEEREYIFYTYEEYKRFIAEVSDFIAEAISEKCS